MRVPYGDHIARMVANDALPVRFCEIICPMCHAAFFRDRTVKDSIEQRIKVLANAGREARILTHNTFVIRVEIVNTRSAKVITWPTR